jgi:hypothetical protein
MATIKRKQVSAQELHVIPWVLNAPATGDNQPWVQIPFSHKIVGVYAVAKTAGSSASTFNIYKATQAQVDGSISWASIFTTALTLDSGERSTNTAAVPHVVNPSQISDISGTHYKVECTVVGTGAANITINLVLERL